MVGDSRRNKAPREPILDNEKVRPSRDGDQFHYLWAARRCLRLLAPTSGLVAISIEDVSPRETAPGESVEEGVEKIDLAEYHGSEVLEEATLIRYVQLKHSTRNPFKSWPPSGLEKTLRGFAERYEALAERFGENDLKERLTFAFVTNRPISSKFIETVEDAASRSGNRRPAEMKKLEKFTSLKGGRLSAFCGLLRLEGDHEAYWTQRGSLALETNNYLPGADVEAPVQIKELVTRKALSESAGNSTITKMDVLRSLGATEDHLFPAPSRIDAMDDSIPREQEADLISKIIEADAPVIVHAAGGAGKTVLSQRIRSRLPSGSVGVVYDSFGNGEYRRVGSPRHRHKDALVQISNELAALGLCDSLIPSSKADNTDYLRAFAHRMAQSAASVKERNAQAVLYIAIDAADNAEMAAREFGEERSFARDLIREPLPDGLRVVFFCRTERLDHLDPPPNVIPFKLHPFSRGESATFLRASYPEATGNDVDEFHRLTSQNPRVQATALDKSGPLSDILASLGPDPTTVDDAIAAMLDSAIAKIRDQVGNTESSRIDLICAGLARLSPPVCREATTGS